MLIQNYKQMEKINRRTNERADNPTDRQKDRHTDSLIIRIMTERESRKEGEGGEDRERVGGREREKQTKK